MKLTTLPDLTGDSGIFIDGDWVESKDQDPKGDVRLIQLADIGIGEYINKSTRFMTSDTAIALKCTFLQPGDILIARMPDPIGRACIFPGDEKPCVTVVDVCILRVDSELVEKDWLLYFLNSNVFQNRIGEWVKGATRQRISRSNLGNIEFEMPDIDDQKKVSRVLKMAYEIRRKHQEAIKLTNELIKSTFLDNYYSE
ncbi:restriction endonuclease subunit S [Methylomonas sp. SURF-2]|uniref:Restriction endonuclease subunit S n=1 Tax=Methylomonas subterranea TaxID=2952225 RepID=A0ABT1TKH9_9GAMM|nr:restriction endonuclease subunit S [Methylomonas sp. SURF-2]MCQ8105989.1 restriction endonuclease subunit S [Methylomonas sp. SURF-2]